MASVLFYCEPEEIHFNANPTLFLDACSKCQKTLTLNDDVFMYQGITAFSSEECRQFQIDIDNPPKRKTTYKLPATIGSATWRYWRPSYSGATVADTRGPVRTRVPTAA